MLGLVGYVENEDALVLEVVELFFDGKACGHSARFILGSLYGELPLGVIAVDGGAVTGLGGGGAGGQGHGGAQCGQQ